MPALVLVADDSATVRAVVRAELEHAGHRVVEAGDGAAVLELAHAEPPDVVLLDVQMPVLDGFATLAALKASPVLCDVPVVFLTGHDGTDTVVRALQGGAHDYLRKPPHPGELLARVSAALRVKELQDELRRRGDELERVSRTDHLTALPNRRHMDEQLSRLLSAARRRGLPLSVLLVDVDHFKRVNDTRGHGVGDLVLREVADRLRTSLRAEDTVGRWGGEEFLVLAPHTGREAATVLAERLRAAVRERPFAVDDHPVAVTVSIGGAAAESAGPHDLLAVADANLYAAKDAGRDRAVITLSEA